MIKIDREAQKLSLGLKPSYFEGEEAEDEEPDVAAGDMDKEAFEAAAEMESDEDDANLGKDHGSVKFVSKTETPQYFTFLHRGNNAYCIYPCHDVLLSVAKHERLQVKSLAVDEVQECRMSELLFAHVSCLMYRLKHTVSVQHR